MGTCDVCNGKLGVFNKFKYAQGYICKECYKKASRQFTETITQKSFAEIKELCDNNYEIREDFEVTGRIGNYLLVDEKNHKICILNNRLTKGQVSKPEIYRLEDISECLVVSDPSMSMEELEQKVLEKDEGVVKTLKILFYIKGQAKPVDITFINNDVRMKSYAFRQSFAFVKRIMEEMNRLQSTI
jgi:hypothetical protein